MNNNRAWIVTYKGGEVFKRLKTDEEKLKFSKEMFNKLKEISNKKGGRPAIHEEVKKQVPILRAKGLSYEKIAKELKISKGSVFNILKSK